MGKENTHRIVQRRYSQGHHQNQATHEGPKKELEERGRTTIVYMRVWPLCEIEDDATEHVLKCGKDTYRKQRNIKNNTEEEWEEVVQIFRENKRKREEKKRESLGKNQFRFGCLVQLWTVDVLVLNWSAQSQDLCWGDTSSSDTSSRKTHPQGRTARTARHALKDS